MAMPRVWLFTTSTILCRPPLIYSGFSLSALLPVIPDTLRSVPLHEMVFFLAKLYFSHQRNIKHIALRFRDINAQKTHSHKSQLERYSHNYIVCVGLPIYIVPHHPRIYMYFMYPVSSSKCCRSSASIHQALGNICESRNRRKTRLSHHHYSRPLRIPGRSWHINVMSYGYTKSCKKALLYCTKIGYGHHNKCERSLDGDFKRIVHIPIDTAQCECTCR